MTKVLLSKAGQLLLYLFFVVEAGRRDDDDDSTTEKLDRPRTAQRVERIACELPAENPFSSEQLTTRSINNTCRRTECRKRVGGGDINQHLARGIG